MPRVLNTNLRSLPKKIDELTAVMQNNHKDIGIITESWLDEDIPDKTVNISGYTPLRNDRYGQQGGGVICFVRSTIAITEWKNLQDGNFESVWLTVKPRRMPRAYPNITIGCIYHPHASSTNDYALTEHIGKCIDYVRQKHPHTGIILAGDFNQYKEHYMKRTHRLKQVVTKPTRKEAILDKVYTDMSQYYMSDVIPQIGKSDHRVVLFLPQISDSLEPPTKTYKLVRSSGANERSMFAHDLKQVRWDELYQMEDVNKQLNFLQDTLTQLLDKHMPYRLVSRNSNDKPWITDQYLETIAKRQAAYLAKNKPVFRSLRNKVSRMSASLRSTYYQDKVASESCPRKFWNNIGLILGTKQRDSLDSLIHGRFDGDSQSLAEEINSFFQSVSKDLPPLAITHSHDPVNVPHKYIIDIEDVEKKLAAIKLHKAPGPDGLPNWLLRDFCEILAPPFAAIANTSLRQRLVPELWKSANVNAVPKVSPPQLIENDLRPISLTPVISKVIEDFVYKWILEIVRPQLHWNQFGALPGSSTVDALVYLLHKAFTATDALGTYVRTVLVDYSKAFDHINHSLLITKLEVLGVPSILLEWIASFLNQRKQRVKIGDVTSQWITLNGGVPQGTKLGPLLFLCMINDLQVSTPTESIKFVDDTTLFEIFTRNHPSQMQSAVDELLLWSQNNDCKLNPRKTKEMITSFSRTDPDVENLVIDGTVVDRVDTAKLLGVNLSSTLKWNAHIDSITSRASQRLFFLTVLRRCNAPNDQLKKVYLTHIRSLLEYACQCWHPGLTKELSDELEMIQSRALAIIHPKTEYEIALKSVNLDTLKERRVSLCLSYFNKIKCEKHKLHCLLPKEKPNEHYIRNQYKYEPPKLRVYRSRGSLINWCLYNLQ